MWTSSTPAACCLSRHGSSLHRRRLSSFFELQRVDQQLLAARSPRRRALRSARRRTGSPSSSLSAPQSRQTPARGHLFDLQLGALGGGALGDAARTRTRAPTGTTWRRCPTLTSTASPAARPRGARRSATIAWAIESSCISRSSAAGRRPVLAGASVGGGDGHRQLFFGDSDREVDTGGRGTCLRPAVPEAAACDVARGGDGGGAGPSAGHRNPTGRGCIRLALQRLPAPARPGMGRGRARGPGALCRRRVGDVQVPAAGRGRAGAASGTAGRSGLGTEGGQDQDCAPSVGGREWTSSVSITSW